VTYDIAIESLASRIPPHWETLPFRRLAALVDAANADRSAPLLSLASTGVIAPREEFEGLGRQMPANETIGRYWLAEPGDLVVNPMWLVGGGIGVSETSGAVSPDYRVYRLGPDLCPRYVHHLLRSQTYRDQYKLYTRAETTFDRRVSKVDFHAMPILVPPLDEQRRIADFLDAETARIDKATALIKRQQQILDDRYQATVDVEIDRTRKLIPLKYIATIVDTEHKTAPAVTRGGYWIAGTASVHRGRIDLAELHETDLASFQKWTKRRLPQPGDVLLSREAPVGEVGLYRKDDPRIAIGQRMVLVSPKRKRVSSEYLVWTLLSSRTKRFIDDVTQGSLHPHLNMSDIGSILVGDISISEQDAVVHGLASTIGELEALNELRSAQLTLLAERRQALIMAAVTGGISV
jgi:type I restriction enzyme, S subunit